MIGLKHTQQVDVDACVRTKPPDVSSKGLSVMKPPLSFAYGERRTSFRLRPVSYTHHHVQSASASVPVLSTPVQNAVPNLSNLLTPFLHTR